MKRVFGIFEVVFDVTYMITAFVISILLLSSTTLSDTRLLAGIMGLILVCGDTFHLVPRIKVILSRKKESFQRLLGRGKQITSITMTVFYLFLWQLGIMLYQVQTNMSYVVYALVFIRILVCFAPQNKWCEQQPPVRWGIVRNIPFFMIGLIVSGLFFVNRSAVSEFGLMWLAILLSFLFYLPVVMWSNRNPKIGMFMIPKTCVYVWMLGMCLSL